ncbi:MAG: excinuclease ABC subunit B, partial [Phycisphaerae bacterium]|nr:excinuclease ABC subunit B [Phycisphaerae bacterium]
MKCDHCANPATVQETVIRNGQVTQRNLCEACARAKGVKVQPGPLAQALTQAVLVQGGAGAEG